MQLVEVFDTTDLATVHELASNPEINIKPLFTFTPVGASPHPARVPLRHRVPSPSRANGWPALDAAGRPQASTAPTGPGDGEAARLWRRRGERQGCPKGLVQTHDRFKG